MYSIRIVELNLLNVKNKFCVNHLPDALLGVFVSIEMSGQSVQFEQKFNYRRPMYEILEYIWTIDSHRNRIKVSQLNEPKS